MPPNRNPEHRRKRETQGNREEPSDDEGNRLERTAGNLDIYKKIYAARPIEVSWQGKDRVLDPGIYFVKETGRVSRLIADDEGRELGWVSRKHLKKEQPDVYEWNHRAVLRLRPDTTPVFYQNLDDVSVERNQKEMSSAVASFMDFKGVLPILSSTQVRKHSKREDWTYFLVGPPIFLEQPPANVRAAVDRIQFPIWISEESEDEGIQSRYSFLLGKDNLRQLEATLHFVLSHIDRMADIEARRPQEIKRIWKVFQGIALEAVFGQAFPAGQGEGNWEKMLAEFRGQLPKSLTTPSLLRHINTSAKDVSEKSKEDFEAWLTGLKAELAYMRSNLDSSWSTLPVGNRKQEAGVLRSLERGDR